MPYSIYFFLIKKNSVLPVHFQHQAWRLEKLMVLHDRQWVPPKLKGVVTLHLTVCSRHVTYAFQRESILYSCLNVNEFPAQSRRKIWSLSDCNWTRTHNLLVHKRTVIHLAKLECSLSARLWIKLFSVRVQLQSRKPCIYSKVIYIY